jgi:hypothetical protein
MQADAGDGRRMQADASGCRRWRSNRGAALQVGWCARRVQGQCRNTPKSKLKSLSFGVLDLDSLFEKTKVLLQIFSSPMRLILGS